MRSVGVLGASGRSGRLIVEDALARGWQVLAQVRATSDLEIVHENLTILRGDPVNEEVIEPIMTSCSGILITLNISRTSEFPWSALRAPENLVSQTIATVVSRAPSSLRIISCSAWGVSDSWGEMPGWFRWLVKYSNIGKAYEDHARQENILKSSNTAWTIIRPVGLTNKKQRQEVQECFTGQRPNKITISRQTVAHYMLDAVAREDLIGKVIAIASK